MMLHGSRIASSTVVSPPFDCMRHQRCGDRCGLELAAERLEIVGHRRHDVGVDDGGRGPLVLLDLRQHVVADAGDEMRGALGEHLLHQQLVGGVLEGVEEADRDRLHPLGEEAIHRRLGRLARKRKDHLATAS